MANLQRRTVELLRNNHAKILDEWQRALVGTSFRIRVPEAELREQSRELLERIVTALDGDDTKGAAWQEVLRHLEEISRFRVAQGFASDETAILIFSLKRPLFSLLRSDLGADPEAVASETLLLSELVDTLGLHTVKAFQRTREDIILRQQQEMLELSTPVIKLWKGILALPLIGTLDSERTHVVMESLLQKIVDTGAEIAIVDITGVPTVDTLVAQHLLKTVTAIRLMGAECIISGIRPQIAQTIVHLGIDLTGVTTKATLADALSLALRRSGLSVVGA